jgi:hypothetical protein
VAELAGYSSERNFYQAVKSLTGRTPAALRRLPAGELRQLAHSVRLVERRRGERRHLERRSAIPDVADRPATAADRRRRRFRKIAARPI